MRNYARANFPVALIAIVEIIVGICLIVDPIRFTFAMVRLVGVFLLAFGILSLITFLTGSRSDVVDENGNSIGANPATLIFSIIAIVIGSILSFATTWIIGLIGVVTIIFGVFFIIFGILKIKNFADKKKAHLPASPLTIVAALISVVLGIIVIANPFTAVNAVWLVAGIALIVTAVVDIVSLITGRGNEVR
ncbi:MAG: DUF308 domain-containing protein [Lachnospiraceae bacterium]|nr:DUF308 domain-containing protein [Lachnospiraceae bacterium]